MANYKTVPNQKIVKVQKEKCDKQNIYAAINIEALELAAQTLDAGAFKLWVYFAKNQGGYEFALSSKDVLDTFGMKIKQYNNAVTELIDKGYLVRQGVSSNYLFSEIAVITLEDNEKESVMPKGNNAVITKEDNAVITKSNNALLPLGIRNNTDTTYNTTIDNTEGFTNISSAGVACSTDISKPQEEPVVIDGVTAIVMDRQEATSKYGLGACINRVAAGVNGCFWISGDLVKLL